MSEGPAGHRFRLGPLSDFPEGSARGFDLAPLEVVVVNLAGKLFAYENRCPHRGTSLDWAPERFLSDDGRFLQCATHGALFERETGRCVAGPCVGDRLRPLALCEEGGYLCLDTGAPAGDAPRGGRP